jgi:hypothetical protein
VIAGVLPWLLAAGAALALLHRLRVIVPPAARSPFEETLRPWSAAPERLDELHRLELAVEFSQSSARDFQWRLRPMLRELAADRGISLPDLDEDSGDDRGAGVALARLRTMIEALEGA